jgi:phage-related protein
MSSVTVEINGRETVSQAALQASGSMKKMGEDSKGFLENITVTAGDVVGAIQKIASSVSEVLNLYAVQERAVINLNSAIELSDNVNKDAAEGLIQYASELQALTGIGDETTIAIQAMLIASGRNEEQTRSMIAAAADYSAATGKDFKTTIEDLNKSFSGTQGRMGQLIPELKDLTEEQLKGGAAIDIVGQKYAGYAERLSGSASVALASFKSSWGDMQESLGEAIMPAVLPILGALVDFINDPVIPVIKSFAPIVQEVFENVEKFITDLRPAVEPIMTWFANTWTTVIGPNIRLVGSILKETLSIVSGIITGDWKRVWDSFKQIVLDVVGVIKNAFSPLIDAITLVVEGIGKAKDFLLTSGQNNASRAVNAPITGGNRYARGTGSASPGVAIVGEEGPELVIMRGGETVIPNNRLTSAAKSLGIPGYAKGTGSDFGFDFASPLMELISSIVGPVMDVVKSFTSVTAILNPLQTIFQAMMNVIGPLVDSVLQPLVGILNIVGATLGKILAPAIAALGPIVTALSLAFVWFYNYAILPVGNLFIAVGNMIYNAVTYLVNGLLRAYNKINNIWGGKDIALMEYRALNDGQLDKISTDDLVQQGYTGSGTTGGNATYQKPRDLTVNVQVYTSALVGNDGISEFSLIIGRELKAAGVLNMS